jgi:hypothetical protein
MPPHPLLCFFLHRPPRDILSTNCPPPAGPMSNIARNVFVESLTFKYISSKFHCHPRPADCEVGKLITVTKTRVVCFDSDGKISTESTRPYPTQELVPTPRGLRVVAILASEGSSSARTANGWLSCVRFTVSLPFGANLLLGPKYKVHRIDARLLQYSPTSSATRMTHDNGLITLGQDVTILDERRM